MVDRGITEVHANETIYKTGIFLQMFPYPCYIYDRFVTISVFLSGPKIYFVTNVNETNRNLFYLNDVSISSLHHFQVHLNFVTISVIIWRIYDCTIIIIIIIITLLKCQCV